MCAGSSFRCSHGKYFTIELTSIEHCTGTFIFQKYLKSTKDRKQEAVHLTLQNLNHSLLGPFYNAFYGTALFRISFYFVDLGITGNHSSHSCKLFH